jgi:FAD/FMN-containing dehydrogenase
VVSAALQADLGRLLGADAVRPGDRPEYLRDALTGPDLSPWADAVALPADREEVAAVVAYCCEHTVPLTVRGGGTGLAGGAVPLEGGVVLSMERVRAVRSLHPLQWRVEVEAGLPTAQLQRIARENGLWFPPDPGAAEQSQIGGNIATDAGGPHSFGFGTTGAFVLGLEAVVPPGELVRFGGPVSKNSTGYGMHRLLVGSEGTLAVITSAWLRLLPAPERQLPLAAFFADARSGCEAVDQLIGSGFEPSVIDFFDEPTVTATAAGMPYRLGGEARFMLVLEALGSAEAAEELRAQMADLLTETGAVLVESPTIPSEVAALWRWRDGVSGVVTSLRGGKVSEDVIVPVEHLVDAIEATARIGREHGLEAMSWGHAGNGNLHSTFLVSSPQIPAAEMAIVREATERLLKEVIALGGSISGEHGIGWLKRDLLPLELDPAVLELERGVKRQFDPAGLLNPGKVLPVG